MLDLCDASGLSRPTVHRILRSMQNAALVRQLPENRRYTLGSGLFELGMAVPHPIPQFDLVRAIVEALAVDTNDTVYLMLRSYDDVLCVWRAQGAYPIKANIVAQGDRRPLASSVAGLCILAGLAPEDTDALIAGSGAQLAHYCRMTGVDVARHVAHVRAHGFSVGANAVMEGVTAIGVAVPARYDRPYLALSVSAINARIPPQRIPELVSRLRGSADRIAAVTAAAA